MKKRKILCYCDNELEVEIPDTVDLATSPEKEQEILDGTFLAFRCDRCGKLLKPEFPIRVVDEGRNLELYMLPELDRGAFARGRVKYALDDKTRGRIVIGYPELVEKIKIIRDALDDRVIEIIKFYLLEKAQADESVRPYYFAKSVESVEFHIYGLREQEIGVSKVPFRIYEQIASELDTKAAEDPFDSILEPPYVSIQKTYREAAE